MRLLICTQAVDSEDPALNFFIRWIEELAKRSERIVVICLRKGMYVLPKNVEVISLGDSHKIFRAFELCGIAWGRRHEYDAVFVHMNPEYIVAAGWLWRLMHKKIVLWYTHKSVNVWLRIATFFANTVLTASKESFRLPSHKVEVVGHGIDIELFMPDRSVKRDNHVISVGRLMPSKRHDLAIAGAAKAGRKIKVIGEGPERGQLEKKANALGADVEFVGPLTGELLVEAYQKAAYFVHTSETGSLDKVLLEALATDTPVITTNHAFQEFPVTVVEATPEAIAQALQKLPENIDRSAIVREQYSLAKLIPRIMHEFV